MPEVLQAVVLHALIFLVVGLPAALGLRNRRDGWHPLLIDSLLYGLVLTTLGIALFSWFGWFGPFLVALLVAAAITSAFARKVGLPDVWIPKGADWWLVAGWTVVLFGALLLRLRSVEFLPWVGDMGAYVNWANEFVRTGMLSASWPPLFPSFLSIGSGLFGPDMATAAMALTGLLLILAVTRLLTQLGAGRWPALVTAGLLALSIHAIWYSSFPSSESLNAPLFIAWLSALVGAIRSAPSRLPAWLGVAGVTMLALGLLRGTAPLLLLPLLLLAILSVTTPDWRKHSVRIWQFFTVSLVGALVSYWYGIERIPRYYVDLQIRDLVPDPIFAALSAVGVFDPTATTAVVISVAATTVCGVGIYLAVRYSEQDGETRLPSILGLLLGGVLIAGIAANAVLGAEVWQILLRMGLWLTIVPVALMLFIGKARLPSYATAFVLYLGTITALFLAIHTYRLKFPRDHSFYLYWDRYIFSELIPLFFVVFGLALAVVWRGRVGDRVRELRLSRSVARRSAPAVVAVALLAAAVAPTLDEMSLVTQDSYMSGAYEFQSELIAMIPDKSLPVAWSATTTNQVPGFFFPNTWMAFAKPMHRSFGYEVVNISDRKSDFASDEVFTAESLVEELACARSERLVVFETQVGGVPLIERLSDQRLTIKLLGKETSAISLLRQSAVTGWTEANITVRGWLVSTDREVLAATDCPA